MSYAYDPPDKFGYKDTLAEGHPEKVIRGSEFDDEFNKIAVAFEVLEIDANTLIPIDRIENLREELDAEEAARIAGDEALQNQIDGLIEEAPDDGKTYGRKSKVWSVINLTGDGTVEEAPEDGVQYARQNATWTPVGASEAETYALPVSLRSGDTQLPLTDDGISLAVMTRAGEVELPLAIAA